MKKVAVVILSLCVLLTLAVSVASARIPVVRTEASPYYNIVLLIQANPSMSRADKWSKTIQSAHRLIDVLADGDYVTVISFSCGENYNIKVSKEKLQGYGTDTDNRQSIKNAISSITFLPNETLGGASFERAFQLAGDLYGVTDSSFQSYVIFISDGDDWHHWGYADDLNRLKYVHRLIALGIGYDVDTEVMQRIADYTWGDYIFCQTGDELRDAFIDSQTGLPNLIIGTRSLSDGEVGKEYEQKLTASSVGCTWSASGLPEGLEIDSQAELIKGVPTQAGTFTVTLTAKKNGKTSTPKTFNLYIAPASSDSGSGGTSSDLQPSLPTLLINTRSLSDGEVGKGYEQKLTASSVGCAWSASGLPDGLAIDSQGELIRGIPTQAGTFTVTLTATKNGTNSTPKNFSLYIAPASSDSGSGGTNSSGYPKIDVLERGSDQDNYYGRVASTPGLISGFSLWGYYADSNNQVLTEQSVAGVYADVYKKTGFTADGNTRLILRVQHNKATEITFRVPSDLGGTLETLDRQKKSASQLKVKTTDLGNGIHQASAVLIAPKDYPSSLSFPRDIFELGIEWPEDVQSSVRIAGMDISRGISISLTLEATPVVLIHGLWGNGGSFGLTKGIYPQLEKAGFNVSCWKYDGTKGPSYIISGKGNSLDKHLSSEFRKLRERGIACTRADLVCHSMGGLMARQYLKKYFDTGNSSPRSYGMDSIRRVVTVATPHEGSPLTSYLLGEFWSLGFDRVSSKVETLFKYLNVPIREFIYLKNGNSKSAFVDLALSSLMIIQAGYPSSVPMYAIYGTIKSDIARMEEFTKTIETIIEGIQFANLLSNPPVTVIQWIMTIIDATNSEGISDVFDLVNEVLYKGEDYDIAVSKPSAHAQDKLLANSKGYNGWNYNHMNICLQDDVGRYVADLLRGPENRFKIFGASVASARTSSLSVGRSSVLLQTQEDETSFDDVFKERFSLTLDPVVVNVSDTATDTATFTTTVDEATDKEVYMLISGNDGDRIFRVGSTDGGKTFAANLTFAAQDAGIYRVMSLSPGEDQDVFISNTAQLIVKLELNNITELGFPGGVEAVFTNVGSEVALGLCVTTADEKIYDISSPLMGTTWSAADASIAEVTESGRVRGLKEGTTTLTATYEGLTASIKVEVGPDYSAVNNGGSGSADNDSDGSGYGSGDNNGSGGGGNSNSGDDDASNEESDNGSGPGNHTPNEGTSGSPENGGSNDENGSNSTPGSGGGCDAGLGLGALGLFAVGGAAFLKPWRRK